MRGNRRRRRYGVLHALDGWYVRDLRTGQIASEPMGRCSAIREAFRRNRAGARYEDASWPALMTVRGAR